MTTRFEVIVEIDPDILELVPDFLARRRDDLVALAAVPDVTTFEDARRIGHVMKGAGGAYGFDAITDIGLAIETAARGADCDAIAALAADLASYLDRVRPIAREE